MRIHQAYKYIFFGGEDLLVVGGPYVTRISGTTVKSAGRTVINCLQKECSVEEVLKATRELETSDRVRKFLQDLISQGLLYTENQLSDNSDPVGKMHDRFDSEFVSLASKNAYGSIENASLVGYLTNDIDRLSGTIGRIRSRQDTPTGGRTDVVALYLTSFETLAIARKADGNYLYAQPSPRQVAGVSAGTSVNIPLNIENDLVKHWLTLAASNKVSADFGSVLKSNPSAQKTVEPLDVTDAVNVRNVETRYTAIEYICSFSAGGALSDGEYRRTAPSAGGLGSSFLFCIMPGTADNPAWKIFCWDEFHGQLCLIGNVARSRLECAGLIARGDVTIIFVGNAARVVGKYGPLGEKLVYADAGVAVEHAARCAHALGTDVSFSDLHDSVELRKLLMLSPDDASTPITGVCSIGFARLNERESIALSTNEDCQAMKFRRSSRHFDGGEIPLNIVQRLEESALGRVEEMLRSWCLADFAHIRLRKTDQGTYSFQKVFSIVSGGVITDLGSVAHAEVRGMFTQTVLADASLILLVPIDYAPDPYDIKVHYRSAGAFLSSAWIEAQKLGLSGTMCGNLDLGRIPRLSNFIGALALCLSSSTNSTD